MANYVHQPSSDETLWRDFKSGKENAFTTIYKQHIKALVSYGYKLTTDTNLIEDCIQDLFIELWMRRYYLSDIDCINFYLLRALNRKLRRKIVQQQKNCNLSHVREAHEMSLEFRWINAQIATENSQKLQKAIEKLSNRQREVLIMHYYEGQNYAEIARVININYQSVANLMYRTMQKLRRGIGRM